ncbi:hypothetical protein F5144DRAFT_621667 [Chaetomium tenue]|uniref:Uncharacterized protein n=1 Tax=Chaetomium tenue TaxID=1854479 RepID=A0ACB7P6A6_9PEZI|nr:hypothetical protein F5144DRAFT_621667 [Chaetomium globosum]
MSTPSCLQQSHHLKIDIDFDRILTIIFPHAAWASSYLAHVESRPYHADRRARLDNGHTGGALALVFDSKRGARDWLANSPLWEASRAEGGEAERSVVIRTWWKHREFEGRLDGVRERAELAGPAELVGSSVVRLGAGFTPATRASPAPAPVPAPFGGSDVLGTSVDPYRRSEMRTT